MQVQGIMGTFGIGTRIGLTQLPQIDVAVLSYPLMIIGGALLLLAAILLGLRHKAFEGSASRDELVSYLSRIATALERMEAPNSSGQTAADVLRHLVNARTTQKVLEMPKYRSK